MGLLAGPQGFGYGVLSVKVWHRISRAVSFQVDWAGLNNEYPCDTHEVP